MTDVKLLHCNTWKNLTLSKNWARAHLKMLSTKCLQIMFICMYKQDLALNNLQWLICHKTKPIYIVEKIIGIFMHQI